MKDSVHGPMDHPPGKKVGDHTPLPPIDIP